MWQIVLHLIWWIFLAAMFGGGWFKGGLLGCSLVILAVLAPFTYTPTPQNLFALYVWWVLPIINKWRNWPSYQHFGIVIDGDCIEFASARGTNNSYWLRTTTFRHNGEQVVVASIDDSYIKTKLPCTMASGIIPPPQRMIAIAESGFQLDLANTVYSLLLGGRSSVKLAILIARNKHGIRRVSRYWAVDNTEFDLKYVDRDRVIS